MTRHHRHGRSDLFLVRLWTEETATGDERPHGKVQRAVNGETTHFDDWQGLLDRLRAMVADDKKRRWERGAGEAQHE
jgi:hypothetical protein